MSNKRQDIILSPIGIGFDDPQPINAVVISGALFQCTKCESIKPAHQFGQLRLMDDGVVRNQAQCIDCRFQKSV